MLAGCVVRGVISNGVLLYFLGKVNDEKVVK